MRRREKTPPPYTIPWLTLLPLMAVVVAVYPLVLGAPSVRRLAGLTTTYALVAVVCVGLITIRRWMLAMSTLDQRRARHLVNTVLAELEDGVDAEWDHLLRCLETGEPLQPKRYDLDDQK